MPGGPKEGARLRDLLLPEPQDQGPQNLRYEVDEEEVGPSEVNCLFAHFWQLLPLLCYVRAINSVVKVLRLRESLEILFNLDRLSETIVESLEDLATLSPGDSVDEATEAAQLDMFGPGLLL